MAGLLAVSGVAALALVGLGVGLAYQHELKAEKAKTEVALQAEGVAHQAAETARQTAETARQAAETARAAEQEQRKKAETYLYYNKIVLAEREWTAGNVGRVKELLQQCPQEARGWEWRYLDQLCRRELASVQGPDDNASGLAISPDGKWVVSGGESYHGQVLGQHLGQGDARARREVPASMAGGQSRCNAPGLGGLGSRGPRPTRRSSGMRPRGRRSRS